ncbi:carbonic anhydrase [Fusarium pseudocircinatum]|uniref:Carbonic anhydrase n=1 Tax=Fusarium pseudocircinatum TaxID=56676 RepID=A0A8H5LGP1_9HYPO|nr:carbonic anhydrase [Fusarium pseudocircinatum]
MRVSQLFAVATYVTSVLSCAKHNNHYSLKHKKRHIDPRAEPGQTDWAYEFSYNWGRLNPDYHLCQDGTQQSPIPIALKQGLSLEHLIKEWNYPDEITGNFFNWGYGPAFTVQNEDQVWTQNPSFSFDNETVYLKGWHIHAPADHTVERHRSRAELHLVHVNAQGKERAVLAIRLDPGNKANSFFGQLPKMIGFNETDVSEEATLNHRLLLESVDYFDEFWTYEGSLTSPPCTEGIRFFIARPILFTSVQQMRDILGASTYSAHHSDSNYEGDERQPHVSMEKVDAHSPPETCQLMTQSGIAKAKLPWADLIVKSIFGGIFISLGSLFDLVVAGGAPGLRESNPSLITLLAAFTFPIGFVLVILTNVELVTSNMAVMIYTTLQRKTSVYDLLRNWVICYVFNLAGCLFFTGVLAWWSDTLNSDAMSSYAVTQAEQRVNINWWFNFTRGIGCNWLVGLAVYLATSSKDNLSKIVGIWIPIWAFVALGYQHSVANFFLVPIGMFYGTNFGVGKFIYQSTIPVTLGNIVGGAVMTGAFLWFLYGRDDTLATKTGQPLSGERKTRGRHVANSSGSEGETVITQNHERSRRNEDMV